MMPLKRDRIQVRRMIRKLPKSSDARGTAKATYSKGGVMYATIYQVNNPEARQSYGITDGSVYKGFSEGCVLVGDRLQDIDTETTYEVLESSKAINGYTLSMKKV